MNELIYSDEQVSISPTAAVLEGTCYSISAISELFILDRRPGPESQTKAASPIFSVIYGTVIFAAASLLAIYFYQIPEQPHNGLSLPGFFAGGSLSIVFFIFVIWIAGRIAGPAPGEKEQHLPDYTLIIGTPAGYRSALSSSDRWYIERIAGCIEYAISFSARARKRSQNLCSID